MDFRQLNSRGLTLVELMVAMVLSLVLMAAVYMAYQVQHKTNVEQDAVSIMQQDQRAAMELISRDIKTAGCNPTGADITSPGRLGIIRTTDPATSLGLVMDLTGASNVPDGQIASPGEYVVYTRTPPTAPVATRNRLFRNDRFAGSSLVAQNVTTFGLVYFCDTSGVKAKTFTPTARKLVTGGSELPPDAKAVNAVQITIGSTVTQDGKEVHRRLVRVVRLRNADNGCE